ncbi:unnamed protein product [marine sediment metagenome]|uniref:Phosphotyrosine protein phosphatase I domain-containing protein n=1 Tax=marine sediment metagenome TaxID=412755 RepID=X0Y405_9ZZZZ
MNHGPTGRRLGVRTRRTRESLRVGEATFGLGGKGRMGNRVRRILFLCTGNSVRSQMAEALLRYRGAGRFEVSSAGSHPAGGVHGMALQVLDEIRVPAKGLRSKSWDEFKGEVFDAVITLCGSARDEAGNPCPVWPADDSGREPVRAHWGFEDPSRSQVIGIEAHLEEFRRVRDEIRECVEWLATAAGEVLDDDAAFADLVGRIAESAPNPREVGSGEG